MLEKNFSEKLTRLSPSEIKVLESLLRRPKEYYYFIGVIWAVGLLLIFLDNNYQLRIAFGVIILIVLLILVININHQKKLFIKDINEGKKKIWRGVLEDKKIVTKGRKTSNIFKIEGSEFMVPKNTWDDVPVNSHIEIHFALHSRYVFLINIINPN